MSQVLQPILQEGRIMIPGDTLIDSTKLRSTKCAGRQDVRFYTSPTIRDAGLGFYAEPQDFVSVSASGTSARNVNGNGKGKGEAKGAGADAGAGASNTKQFQILMQGQLVLQCRQKPGSFTIQTETMKRKTHWPEHVICHHAPSSKIEWLGQSRNGAIPYCSYTRSRKSHSRRVPCLKSKIQLVVDFAVHLTLDNAIIFRCSNHTC
jgi:hypothetical protein